MTDDPMKVRERYFGTLGILRATPDAGTMQKAALDRAYELRTFEIGLVWTRATYFFTAQAAIFAAFALVIRERGWDTAAIAGALALLGLATAWFGHLAAYGSRFWQQNWEHHIDLLEDELEGRLHKSIVLKRGQWRFSVSRSQIELTRAQTGFWMLMLAIVPYRLGQAVGGSLPGPLLGTLIFLAIILLELAAGAALFASFKQLQSHLLGRESPLADPSDDRETTAKRRVYELIRRESPAGWPAAEAKPPPPPDA